MDDGYVFLTFIYLNCIIIIIITDQNMIKLKSLGQLCYADHNMIKLKSLGQLSYFFFRDKTMTFDSQKQFTSNTIEGASKAVKSYNEINY